jgi:hypothetical protein
MTSDQSTITTGFVGGGSIPWTSPELIHPGKFGLEDCRRTKESNCYALGMVIYEVLSGQRPFTELTPPIAIVCAILDDERPRRPLGKKGGLFTDDIWETLELCWKYQPRNRISASAVLLRLEGHPPLLGPPVNVDGDAETGRDDQSDTNSSVFFFPSYPWLIFNYPRAIAETTIVLFNDEPPLPQTFDDGLPSPQTANPKGGWLERTWGMFEATTRKIRGL